jgi:predicted RNase H-like HicB family nuclease
MSTDTHPDTTTYTALAERSGNWWAIDVPELKGVHTQAKRLDQIEPMVRDAIALMLNVPEDSFGVDVRPHLTPAADDAVMRLDKARREVIDAQKSLAEAATAATVALVKGMGLTVRDAGRIIGVSYQRVDQLLHRDG